VKGSISYAEFNPLAMSIRPQVTIYVPMVESLEVKGNIAVLREKAG